MSGTGKYKAVIFVSVMKVSPEQFKLQTLTEQIDKGELRIPVFQRSYIWKKSQVRLLMDSIFHEYPTGALLFMSNSDELASNWFENAPHNEEGIDYLVLDGQQRLTSCYHVLYDKAPNNRYFIKLDELFKEWKRTNGNKEEIDFDEKCIITKPNKGKPPTSIVDYLLPFSYLRNPEKYSTIMAGYASGLPCSTEEEKEFVKFIQINLLSLISPFFNYQFYAMVLPKKLDLNAVCRVFETLNNSGTKLDTFDICVAKFKRHGIEIKTDLENAIKNSDCLMPLFANNQNRELPLVVIALYTGADHKKNSLAKLKSDYVRDYWGRSITALVKTIEILEATGAEPSKSLKFIPYMVAIPVIAAALIKSGYIDGKLPKGRESLVDDIVHQYFFYTALDMRYTEGTPSKMKEDVASLTDWIVNGNMMKQYTEGVEWNFDRVSSYQKNQNGAIPRAIKCVYNLASPQSFYNKARVDIHSEDTELHHIFPLDDYEGTPKIDSILNLVFQPKSVNRSIGSETTKKYIADIVKKRYSNETQVREMMKSHLVDGDTYDSLVEERYQDFIEERAEAICNVLEGRFNIKLKRVEIAIPDNDEQFEDN